MRPVLLLLFTVLQSSNLRGWLLLTVEKEGEDMARKMLALQGANKRLKEKLQSQKSELIDLRRTGTPRPNSDPIFEVIYSETTMTCAQLMRKAITPISESLPFARVHCRC